MGAVLLLAILYAGVIGLGDARAWSGSDAGGRVATVKWMAEHHSWVPQVGYWAAEADPGGVHHPLYHTELRGGHWVQPASLPFVVVGRVLWTLGGPRALLVLPALGSLLAALSARRLARAVGAPTGWAAFWLVGAAGPALFYAGDFWEHSAAVGVALAALALLWSGDDAGPTSLAAAVAGVLAGLAVVLRTEMAIFLVALGAASLAVRGERRHWLARRAQAAAAIGGCVATVLAAIVVDRRVLGGTGRAVRAGSSAAQAGSQLAGRAHDAVLTSVGLFADDSATALLLGAIAVTGLVVLGWLALRPRSGAQASLLARTVGVIGAALVGLRATAGAGFIPGLFGAAPLAGPGAVAAAQARGDAPAERRARVMALGAIGALPVVWAFEWRGQLLPQWGGRYVLLTGALLTIVASVSLERSGISSWPPAVLVASALVVGSIGAVWHIERTRGFGRALAQIEQAPTSTVIISTITHLGREGGAFYGDHRWLSAADAGGVQDAAALARQADAPAIDVVTLDEGEDRRAPAVLSGYRLDGVRSVPLLGLHLRVTAYSKV
jgi:hypothetical protein